MAKYKITEENLQNIISESINRILIENQNDESIGGWLGRRVNGVNNWWNKQKNDYNNAIDMGNQEETPTNKQPQNNSSAQPETPQTEANGQITLDQIGQELEKLNQQFAALKGEKPIQTNDKQQTASQERSQNTENDVQKLQQAFFDEIKKGKEAGLGYDKKTKQFTNPHNLTNVDLEKWNAELKPYYQKWYQAFKANKKLNETKIKKIVLESVKRYLKTMK